MGVTRFAKDVAKTTGKYALHASINAFAPGAKSYGHDGPTHEERELARVLDNNYAYAEREYNLRGLQRQGRRIALCIGCNYPHDRKKKLVGCVNDAHHWAELLTRNYGFECLLMTDDALAGFSSSGWKKSSTPTVDNVIQALNSLVSQLQYGDCLAITFSGHGTNKRDRNGDSISGSDQCIVLPDKKQSVMAVPDDQLYQIISRAPKGSKVTGIFDCCKSGGALDLEFELMTKKDSRGNAKIGPWKKVQRNPNPCHADITLISGCNSSQSSLEVSGIAGRGGALTTEMTQLLSRDPYLFSYGDLLSNVIYKVANNRSVQKAQSPQCPTLSASIPFDVGTRMFGPDQMTGIEEPVRHQDVHHGKATKESKSLFDVSMQVAKWGLGQRKQKKRRH